MKIEDRNTIINAAEFLRLIAPLIKDVTVGAVGQPHVEHPCATADLWAEALANTLDEVLANET